MTLDVDDSAVEAAAQALYEHIYEETSSFVAPWKEMSFGKEIWVKWVSIAIAAYLRAEAISATEPADLTATKKRLDYAELWMHNISPAVGLARCKLPADPVDAKRVLDEACDAVDALEIERIPQLEELSPGLRDGADRHYALVTSLRERVAGCEAALRANAVRKRVSIPSGEIAFHCMVDKNGRAWVEVDVLPDVLRKITDAAIALIKKE